MDKDKLQIAESTQHLGAFATEANFNLAVRQAQCLAASTIVPTQYQGEAGVANCIIALEMANRIGASPMMIMQNLYIVHGNPGFSSKFLISCLNTSGKFTPLRYEFKGEEGKDSWACRAYASDKSGEILYGTWISIGMAKSEQWYDKKGSKWVTMPEQMLRYRAAAFFQRTYAPEISMGMQTAEEIIDVEYEDVTTKVKEEIKENANSTPLPTSQAVEKSAPEEAKEENVKPIGEQPKPSIFD